MITTEKSQTVSVRRGFRLKTLEAHWATGKSIEREVWMTKQSFLFKMNMKIKVPKHTKKSTIKKHCLKTNN